MRFFVTCAKGTEGALRRELVALRIYAPRGEAGGVSFRGSFAEGMKVCLWSRVGMRVLQELATFSVSDADGLYAGARTVDWHALVTPKITLAVSAAVWDSETVRHSGFAALKVKDAVVDAIRERVGARPNVSPEDPDVALFLHLRGRDAHLYADLAGKPLHRRGYRLAMTAAPLKETLAAAVLALGGVDPTLPFVDPMAGSGTFAIEHALAARHMAPGLRRQFGFERWPDQSERRAWAALKAEAEDRILAAAPAPIVVRDIAADALRAARRNADAAGVAQDLRFEVGDAGDLRPFGQQPGNIVINPPYGERMGGPESALEPLYERLVGALPRMKDWRLVLLAGNPLLAHTIGRKPRVSHRLWNGPLEVRLLQYQI